MRLLLTGLSPVRPDDRVIAPDQSSWDLLVLYRFGMGNLNRRLGGPGGLGFRFWVSTCYFERETGNLNVFMDLRGATAQFCAGEAPDLSTQTTTWSSPAL